MAANMIGVHKRIIAFDNEGSYMVMFNPRSSKSRAHTRLRKAAFFAHGHAETRRWQSIKVQYQNENADTAQDLHRLDRADHPA